MYEFHGWFRLSETTEESDTGQLDAIIDELNELVVGLDFPTNVSAEVTVLNGEYYLLLQFRTPLPASANRLPCRSTVDFQA